VFSMLVFFKFGNLPRIFEKIPEIAHIGIRKQVWFTKVGYRVSPVRNGMSINAKGSPLIESVRGGMSTYVLHFKTVPSAISPRSSEPRAYVRISKDGAGHQ
jgi:hypothetical protein